MSWRIAQLVVMLVAVAGYLVRLPPAWVERFYTRGFYAAWQPVLTGASNALPFALLDVIVLAGVGSTIAAVVRFARRLAPGRRLRAVTRLAWSALALSAAIYVSFLAAWGLNYEREPITARLRFDQSAVTPAAVAALAREAIGQANRLHDEAHRQGFAQWAALPAVMGPTFRATVAHLVPQLNPRPGVPKWSLVALYFPYAGISGMTDPFALEIIVDRTQLPFERAFVTAHEWAHLAGWADEAEANFVGWLTCVRGRAPEAYSGWLFAVMETLGAVPRPERGVLAATLGAGPRADLAAIAARGRRVRPSLQMVSWRLYDRYLKANRVGEGVRSYDRVVTLLAGTRFQAGWLPVTVGN